ncbi:MAG: class I SAM-dependent methyltransferase [Pyrinomonadaceae bacterium]
MDLLSWQNIKLEDLHQEVAADENLHFVLNVMKTLLADPVWTAPIVERVESGQIETRCFISWLARELQPKAYLEIGVRRGFSMAMVAARSPETEIYGFDLWVPDYAGVPNPGPKFVKSEIRKTGYGREVHLINGDSHVTLPAFFRNERSGFWDRLRYGWTSQTVPDEFDLMMIDGDHSLAGAYQDLLDTMPHCSIGGAVVFDDIMPGALKKEEGEADPHGWTNLLGVWHAVQQQFPNFRYFEFLRDLPGVGVAVRLK